MTEENYLVIGKIGSTYGVKGWIKVLSFTEEVENIIKYQPWLIEDKGGWKEITIEDCQAHGKGIIVKFAGYDVPEKSKILSGKKIAILKSQLPVLEKNEYYWQDLKGLTVINQRGENLGEVSYLIATGTHDVLVVKGNKEHAVPYIVGEVIQDIDLKNRVIHVNWEVI